MSQTVKALLSIRERVLNGEFVPGERLLETSLVEMLEVSRTPIRAALARLTEEGLLEKSPGGGYTVREFTEQDIQHAIELRGTLEGVAARLAAERGVSQLGLSKMKDCIIKVDKLLEKHELDNDDIGRYLELNDTFHNQLKILANSFVVAHMLDRIFAFPFASPNNFVVAQSQLGESWRIFVIAQEHHRGIVDAIEHREGRRAEDLAREHARLSLQVLRTVLTNESAFKQISGLIPFLDT